MEHNVRPFCGSRLARLTGLVWLMGCLIAGAYLVTRPEAEASVAKPIRQTTEAIERIQVGQRVVTPETVAGVAMPTAVDPTTWRSVSLRMVNHWTDGTVDTMLVQTLQPPAWLSENQVRVGARVPIPLDLKEMGVDPQLAEVTAVSACPPIESGPGRVVLTTVNHLSNFLFDLAVQGDNVPPSQVEVTGWHKLYSEDRQAWVSVSELKTGEKMRGRLGPLTVASLVRHPGTETIYNMTVEGEHQYYVADARLLAHNADCGPSKPNKMNQEVKRGQAPRDVKRVDPAHVPGQQDHVHYTDGTSSNVDGSTHDKVNGTPAPSNAARDWLESHGWTPPPK